MFYCCNVKYEAIFLSFFLSFHRYILFGLERNTLCIDQFPFERVCLHSISDFGSHKLLS